jgi:hypothetical protein
MTEPPPTVLLVLKDARQEADSAEVQLREVTELLLHEEYVRALGAFEGLEERVHYVGTILRRYTRHLGLRR